MKDGKSILLHNALIVTQESVKRGSIIIKDGRIDCTLYPDSDGYIEYCGQCISYEELPGIFQSHGHTSDDLHGKHIMAGGIDAHVHFRDPGLTHKADFCSESMAALLGGITSVIDMPNTMPATTSLQTLSQKYSCISGKSWTNFGLHIGATNSNSGEIIDMISGPYAEQVAGIKVFMGSSTGNMLVDSKDTLERIFSIREKPVLVHCEDEATIRANLIAAKERYGENIPFAEHPAIRSRRACILSTIRALELAIKHGTRLHLCHVSTKEEVRMIQAAKALNPDITAETSVNYLWFSDRDYDRLGSRIKCNPAIKTEEDRYALIEGILDGTIDTIGTDHAPHLISEKSGNYCDTPSGIPSIQHSLPVMLTIADRNGIPLEKVSSLFSCNASRIFNVKGKGKIGIGMDADLTVFDPEEEFVVSRGDIAYRCGWSPYEGEKLKGRILDVYIAGVRRIENGTMAADVPHGRQLSFNKA
ncbi:MAG: dihydroorotase [Bacteroidales bacterium]|nr:dihydroorotase [Bacteroidales bacterium]